MDITNGLSCPIPISDYPNVLLAHGGGGKLTNQLIAKMFLPAFDNPALQAQHDGAVFRLREHSEGDRKESPLLAFSTDSYVIHPLFFPGGDIGSLAVHGTVNDLAMCGARPLYLSAGYIIEEGLPMDTLWRIVQSMQQAAQNAGVQIVTGDTKVVDRGKGDGVFINTAGVGIIEHDRRIAPQSVRPGDVLIVSGDIGRHGIAIMAVREGLEFETTIESDSAAVAGLVMQLLAENIEVHCLRDLTRGGLASALNEIAESAGAGIAIEERRVPVRDDVHAACEILGFDPLYVACEGRFVAFVAAHDAERALAIMRAHPLGADATIIGTVKADHPGVVMMKSRIGVSRIVDMISGEQLPRIC
ncbi:MAG: hydrogenase expression/formation protein HypE [Chloroflexi bacterium]|nr:hydrogenase expression/formation protein HypE [Chloroflexota bacterium]MCL5274997.1 hydrogenase expression/formation protein HypE [Chloroflexota bacterium]